MPSEVLLQVTAAEYFTDIKSNRVIAGNIHLNLVNRCESLESQGCNQYDQ